MSKKIVVITGSPRKKGNSFAMTAAFIKAAEEKGHTVKRFDAAMMNVSGCHACETCFKTGKACSFDDDFNVIAPAIQEADGCLRTIRNYRIDYPVCYDIEQASAAYALGEGVTITPALAKQLVSSFCNRIEAGGYYAILYTNRSFLDNYLGNDLAKRYAFWYARYASSFDGTDCGMWQYTNEGSVPGIGGNVDLDIGYIDYPGIIRRAGLNHLSETAPPPAPPSAPTYITYTIQPGDTLSEIAERFGTTVASLSALNGISDPNLIYAGNTLLISQ